MNDKTGGPAFPQIESETVGARGEYRARVYSDGGMTMRDYFAAKAMQALITAPDDEPFDRIAEIPEYAYQIADAMLAERAK